MKTLTTKPYDQRSLPLAAECPLTFGNENMNNTTIILLLCACASLEAAEMKKQVAEDTSFPRFFSSFQKHKADKAFYYLYNDDIKDFRLDYRKKYFSLDEDSKIAFIVYLLANELIVDGELSQDISSMFAQKTAKMDSYDKSLARKRFNAITEMEDKRISSLIM